MSDLDTLGDAIGKAVNESIEDACPFCNAHAHYDGSRDNALAVAKSHHLVIATGEHAYRDPHADDDPTADTAY